MFKKIKYHLLRRHIWSWYYWLVKTKFIFKLVQYLTNVTIYLFYFYYFKRFYSLGMGWSLGYKISKRMFRFKSWRSLLFSINRKMEAIAFWVVSCRRILASNSHVYTLNFFYHPNFVSKVFSFFLVFNNLSRISYLVALGWVHMGCWNSLYWVFSRSFIIYIAIEKYYQKYGYRWN